MGAVIFSFLSAFYNKTFARMENPKYDVKLYSQIWINDIFVFYRFLCNYQSRVVSSNKNKSIKKDCHEYIYIGNKLTEITQLNKSHNLGTNLFNIYMYYVAKICCRFHQNCSQHMLWISLELSH